MSPRPSANVTYASEKRRLAGQPLTDDERAVLELVRLGATTTEIAEKLGIPERRAKLRIDTLRMKAGVRFKRQLITWGR